MIRISLATLLFGSLIVTPNFALGEQKKTPKQEASKQKASKHKASKHKASKHKVDKVGRELFVREWTPQDKRSPGGDGLGPMFNDTSCVGCHNQGGTGGGGSASKNIEIMTAFSTAVKTRKGSQIGGVVRSIFGSSIKKRKKSPAELKKLQQKARQERAKLVRIHAGLRTANSIVLHRFSTSKGYTKLLYRFANGQNAFGFFAGANVQGGTSANFQILQLRSQSSATSRVVHIPDGKDKRTGFAFVISQRNPTALFGGGLIDSIPERVLNEQAKKTHAGFPAVSGRVARLKNGRIGRFGWKAQKASLRDFVLTACAVELGLNVPKHAQTGDPQAPKYKAPGLDLSDKQCNSLIQYVSYLPAPKRSNSSDLASAGEKIFSRVGCTACHTEQLGKVKGLFSDLLLHDMGPSLADTGSYGSVAPNTTEDEDLNRPLASLQGPAASNSGGTRRLSEKDRRKLIGALRQEWRTPPLWGLRDSAPYMHDGRASSVAQAIAFHGGEAKKSSQMYFHLTEEEKQQVLFFLRSLVARN